MADDIKDQDGGGVALIDGGNFTMAPRDATWFAIGVATMSEMCHRMGFKPRADMIQSILADQAVPSEKPEDVIGGDPFMVAGIVITHLRGGTGMTREALESIMQIGATLSHHMYDFTCEVWKRSKEERENVIGN